MTNEQVVQQVVAWAEATGTGLTAFDHAPDFIDVPFPFVIVELETETLEEAGADFPLFQMQQVYVHSFRFNLTLVADAGTSATGARDASVKLRSLADQLGMGLANDPTMGNRGIFGSPLWEADYTLPFVTFDDQTRGRGAELRITVADPIEVEP